MKKLHIFILGLTALLFTACSNGPSGPGGSYDPIEDTPVVYTASGLPAPGQSGIPMPDGSAQNLTVLDWAGFSGAVSYTFDDGQPSHIAYYNELNDTGVHMTFYFVSNMVAANAVTTFSQAVSDGHEMGNHTVSHSNVSVSSTLSSASWAPAEATPQDEMDNCTSYITTNFNQSGVWSMASPYGDLDWGNFAETRFLLNRKVGGGTISPLDNTNQYALPCYMALSSDDAYTYIDYIDEARRDNAWRIFCFHSIAPTTDEWYEPVEIGDITYSIKYGKSTGDTWIDSLIDVGAYWIAQKMFDNVVPVADANGTTWTWTLPDFYPPGKYLRVTVDGGTLSQNGTDLTWDEHGFYEVSLDEGELTLSE